MFFVLFVNIFFSYICLYKKLWTKVDLQACLNFIVIQLFLVNGSYFLIKIYMFFSLHLTSFFRYICLYYKLCTKIYLQGCFSIIENRTLYNTRVLPLMLEERSRTGLSSFKSLHFNCIHWSSGYLCIFSLWFKSSFCKFNSDWLGWPHYSLWVTLFVSLSLWQLVPLVKPWKNIKSRQSPGVNVNTCS